MCSKYLGSDFEQPPDCPGLVRFSVRRLGMISSLQEDCRY